jgi:hypothetical protein
MNWAGAPELSSIRRVELKNFVSDVSQNRIPTSSISAPLGTLKVASRSPLMPLW